MNFTMLQGGQDRDTAQRWEKYWSLKDLPGIFLLSFLVVNLSPGRALGPILLSPTIHLYLKTGIVLIMTIMPGFTEQVIYQGGWVIRQVST